MSANSTCVIRSAGRRTLRWPTTQHNPHHPPPGYIAALIAVLGFGSNFIPAKKVDTGDGIYFQVSRGSVHGSVEVGSRTPYTS